MKKAMLPDNLIKRYTLFKRALPAICLGLLPSQVFAATPTCETYPDCATLGYTQTSCDDYSISLKCPFDNSKLFCYGCHSSSIKDPNNNVCVDGKTYCANQNKEFDSGKCISCAANEAFDKNKMECVHKCVAGGYEKAVPSNHVCIRTQYSGETCYTNCVETPNCGDFTGYVSSTGETVISVNGGTIGIVREDIRNGNDVYYKPKILLKSGSFDYDYVVGMASTSGGMLPMSAELSIINGLSQKIGEVTHSFSSLKYWTGTPCGNTSGYYTLYGVGCIEKSKQFADSAVILKKCNSEE